MAVITACGSVACPAGVCAADITNYLYDTESTNDDYTYSTRKYSFNNVYETNGTEKGINLVFGASIRDAEYVWVGEPIVECCDHCKDLCDISKVCEVQRITITTKNRSGLTYTFSAVGSLKTSNLSGYEFGNEVIDILIKQRPGPYCPYCGRHVGDRIRLNGVYVGVPVIKYRAQPYPVKVNSGESTAFDIKLDYAPSYLEQLPKTLSDGTIARPFKWCVKVDGVWKEIDDGLGPHGEDYSGSETNRLTIKKVRKEMNGFEYCCKLRGVWTHEVYSDPASITVMDAVTPDPTVVPDPTLVPDPTVVPDPTIVPDPTVVPKPTVAPDPTVMPDPIVTKTPDKTPTPAPVITPAGGSKTDYKPATSSSAIIPSSGSSQGTSSGPGGSSSDHKTSTTSRSSDTNETYKGDIKTGSPTVISNPSGSLISARDPAGSSSDGEKKKSTGKKSGSGSSSPPTSSSAKSTSSRMPGSSTVMKNGVLYIVDGDDEEVGTEGELSKDEDVEEESIETEKAYSAADLASEAEAYEQEAEKGFFQTVPGYAVIIGGGVLILLLALFFLFFGVLVFGEVEEHDEVFELCGIRLMRRHEGNWCINLGSAFDDNAVLKLRLGVLFAIMFDEWEITGEVSGMYEGEVAAEVKQNMLVYRRNIRRNV